MGRGRGGEGVGQSRAQACLSLRSIGETRSKHSREDNEETRLSTRSVTWKEGSESGAGGGAREGRAGEKGGRRVQASE